MTVESTASVEPTLLRALLRARHWQKHSTFAMEWDKAARGIDPKLVGTWPKHAQFYRWLRGDLRELPYPDACRVLEAMFPDYEVRELFEPCEPETAAGMKRLRVSSNDLPCPFDSALTSLWPRTVPDALHDLIDRVASAQREISVFGLARNFYASEELLPLFESRADDISVTFYMMEPHCGSRRDRYRLEPTEAEMEEPARYLREVLRPLFLAAQRVAPRAKPSAGMHLYTYNFPCSFAIEKIDDVCRVMLYGHGKRGTEGPIFVFAEGTPYWDYFDSQMRWLERLATDPREPWTSKGLVVKPVTEADVALG